MKNRHRVRKCLNCGALLDEIYNFCPMCGQENNDNNMSFGVLIHDFFSNYFAFDSKFFKTVIPFLFKPGFLTNRYNEGKRVTFAHPLRLYLVISLFYFFICSLLVKNMLDKQDTDNDEIVTLNSNKPNLTDEQKEQIKAALSPPLWDSVKTQLKNEEDLALLNKVIQHTTTTEEKNNLRDVSNLMAKDSLPKLIPDSAVVDTTNLQSDHPKKKKTYDEDNFFLPVPVDIIYDYAKNKMLSERQVMDSLGVENFTPFERYSVRQTVKIIRADRSQVGAYVVKNLPIMMLVLIPIFALILMLLYIRRKRFYINHLIHALHLHSFAYFFYGMTLILTGFIIKSDVWSSLINTTSFILVTTYAYVSFLRVYKQGWIKTLVKFNLVGMIYSFTIFFFFLIEMLISFALF